MVKGMIQSRNHFESDEITFWEKEEATPAQGTTSAKWNLDNFRVPTNAPHDQKCCLSSQPGPKHQVSSGLYI